MRKNNWLYLLITGLLLPFNVFSGGVGTKKELKNKPYSVSGFSASTITNGMSIGAGMGLMIPYTDLSPYRFLPKPNQVKNHVSYGYTAYLEREIKWGLGARIQYHNGKLKGQRRTDIAQIGPTFAFKTEISDLSLQIRYDLTDALFENEDDNRLYVSVLAGGGMLFYRSYTYYLDVPGWVYQANGYVVENPAGTRKLKGKEKMVSTFYVPTTVRFGYRYNYKTDIHFEAKLSHTFVDNLDAFERPTFTANDKYSYLGLGITYNFGREEEDLKIKGSGEYGGMSGDINDTNVAKRRGVLGRIINKKEDTDKDLEMKMKLYDTQLKMLELEYLKEKK